MELETHRRNRGFRGRLRLILEYAEAVAVPRSPMPSETKGLQHELRVIGLALAACEKSVQIVCERELRPPGKLHEPWVTRVIDQLLAAFGALGKKLGRRPLAGTSSTITQAGVSAAVAWQFTQQMLPKVVSASGCLSLVACSEQAELPPEFMAAPHGGGAFRNDA